MEKQMCVCRVERVDGDGGGLGTEILRRHSDGSTFKAPNIDTSRTHLNVSIVKAEGVGGNAIVQAINNRIKSANITRKVADNQCRALVFYLSGTHEQMKAIESQGRLNEWADDCHEWLKEQFGANNIVSMELHRDEFTPHIHAVVVPITTEQRKRRTREGEVKRKVTPKVRLSADHFMKKATMSGWQDSFFERMKKYGLDRGVKGSMNRHKSMNEYYRELKEKKIPEAEQRMEQAKKRIENLTKTIASLNDRILDLEGEIAKREINLENTDNLQKQHDELVTKLEDKKQKLEEAHNKLLDLSNKYKNNLDRTEKAKENFNECKKKADAEKKRLGEIESKVAEIQKDLKQKEKELHTLIDKDEEIFVPTVVESYEYLKDDFPSISVKEIPTFNKKEWVDKKNETIEKKCRCLVDKARKPLEEQINEQNDKLEKMHGEIDAERRLRKKYEDKYSLNGELNRLAQYAGKAIVDYITSDKKAEDLRRQLLWTAKQAVKAVFEHAFKIEPYDKDINKAIAVTFKGAYSIVYELYKLVENSLQREVGRKFVEDTAEEQVDEISKDIQKAKESIKDERSNGFKR